MAQARAEPNRAAPLAAPSQCGAAAPGPARVLCSYITLPIISVLSYLEEFLILRAVVFNFFQAFTDDMVIESIFT